MKELVRQLSFSEVVSQADREAVFELREKNYRLDSDYLLHTHTSSFAGEDAFDQISHLFCVKLGDTVIASCRLTPYNNQHWALEGLVDPSLLDFCERTFAQFNRILVDRSFRNRGIHDFMFLGVSDWGLRYTNYRNYFSICQVAYLRFYADYGIEKVNETPLVLKHRKGLEYYLIQSDFISTNKRLIQKLMESGCLPKDDVHSAKQQEEVSAWTCSSSLINH